ncbi:lysozyme family protein [Rhodococcus ruber]|uniref:hypothetical protein n=1 Tax=Rhodococcus ruber TaxID=1830 RepID=UPI001AEA109E|nr:hypothetical protein [Rhodococcus ruber]MBP2211075.1 lysozyme family protein [Rhodococcus ruber]
MADAIEIVAREARARIEAALPQLVEAVVPALVEAALRGDRVEDVATPTPTTQLPNPKADAKDRARRTLLQGLVATVLVGVTTALGASLSSPDFSVFELASWSTAGTAAVTAALMAVVSYVQRLVLPPKGD